RSVTTSPAFTSKVMPCRMWLSPYQACTSRTASWASGMAGSHISFDDLRIGGDLTVGSLGQDLAAGEHRDAIGKVGDHRWFVLYHENGPAPAHLPDHARRAPNAPPPHPAQRSIQKEHARIERE